jgi:hypothetical protein
MPVLIDPSSGTLNQVAGRISARIGYPVIRNPDPVSTRGEN